ncbi:MAG: PaaX family transcriptional regulator [Chloroflexota bacterium]
MRFRPQPMIFTLWGDYVTPRSADIWVGSLIKLLETLGLTESSVRLALSRMSRNGWLKARRLGNRSFYSLTAEGLRLIEEGDARIFDRDNGGWDGQWRMLTFFIPESKRELRDRLRRELTWMGYGQLSNATYITPHDLRERTTHLIDELDIRPHVEVFTAEHTGFSSDTELVAHCWDLAAANRGYARFIKQYEPELAEVQRGSRRGRPVEPSECFVRRARLIQEFRHFFFLDPELPGDLLPSGWLGHRAVALFRSYHDLLSEGAEDFFDSVYVSTSPGQRRKRSSSRMLAMMS